MRYYALFNLCIQYLGQLTYDFPTDQQSLHKGARCHKRPCDQHLHGMRRVSEGSQCFYLLGYTL